MTGLYFTYVKKDILFYSVFVYLNELWNHKNQTPNTTSVAQSLVLESFRSYVLDVLLLFSKI